MEKLNLTEEQKEELREKTLIRMNRPKGCYEDEWGNLNIDLMEKELIQDINSILYPIDELGECQAPCCKKMREKKII
tara:strand:+ start:146 stop:376 length:231 start_codon:yes stop_codon:yes gene_type:complete